MRTRFIGGVFVRQPTIDVLTLLYEAYKREEESRCIRLDVKPAVYGCLLRRRWAFRSYLKGYEEPFWTITFRGIRIIEEWNRGFARRDDGLCPRCEKSPKVHSYCKVCESELRKQRWEKEKRDKHG